ncbi:alpha/beta fold hydrolase [Nocardia sp. 2]|uniref:Alpha/beta fold hydrolase n=1 Tax=Nocardia acididurans TaxID=2802282 RepID=A0ABS1M3A3_9NOCA|nr:alpha/beta hydrolase [Nocardia acididurans]MBL1075016.1 alpha/beta fold hydrolase [Nocardia acididurans]
MRFRVGMRVAVAGLVLVAAGCGSSEDGPDAGLEKFYSQNVTWGSCEGFSSGQILAEVGMQCAKVTVPVDYSKLDGDTAQIAVSRLAASGAKVGSMLTNPGGPGGVGLTMPVMFAKSEVAQRFDVIGVDVRGLGSSTPKVVCRTPEEFTAERTDLDTDMSPAGIAQTEKEHRELVAKCVERTGTEFLSHVGTVDVARDFDVIRAALGDEKLTYFGVSYGSRLGSTIASLYPERIRAMVLDGGVDPANDSMVDLELMATGFQTAFEAYAADCAKAADCPLGTDPAQSTARLRGLVNPLIERPVPAGDRQLGFMDAQSALLNSLYSPLYWPDLTKGLTELTQGRGDTLIATADLFASSEFVERDLQMAVLCREDARVTDRAEAAAQDRRIRATAPILDDGHGSDQAPLDVCAIWPVPAADKAGQDYTGLPPTLAVATTGDPATPYQGGVNLARALGSKLITYEGVQHGAAGVGIACVDEPVTRYLVDLTVPQEDLRCAAA